MGHPLTELELRPGADPAEAVAAALDALRARPQGQRTEDRVLLDTFDGRLRAKGLQATRPGPDPDADPAVRDARGIRALLPVARVRSAVEEAAVDGATLVVEVPELVAADGGRVPLAPRLRLDGEPDLLGPVLADGRWQRAARSLFDEASLAAGRDPRGTSSKVRVALERGTPVAAAARALLDRLADVAQANVPGTLDDLDTEFLHDLRVSVRRTRSLLRELRGVHEPEARSHLRTELKWVQAATGPVRDIDVQLLDWDELGGGPELEPVRAVLLARRAAALEALRADLQGPRFAAALAAWRSLPAGGPRAQLPVEDLAADRIRRVYRRMARDGRAIGDGSPAEDLHELRKRGKELRYLLELFGGLYDQDVVKPMVAALKKLQDVLGRFQDRAVQAQLLAGAAAEAGCQQALAPVLEALEADQRAARAEFHERFDPFAAKKRRKLVKKTFRKLPG